MRAVVLAAGRGTRMGELTVECPKPMLPVGGRPLLEHILERLIGAGVDQALLVTGYRAEMIEDYFRDWRIPVAFVRQERVDGTGSATLLAREWVGAGSFFLTFGDILMDAADYGGMAERFRAAEGPDAVAAVKWEDDPYKGAAVYEREGLIERIVEKPPQGTSTTHWNSAGCYVFGSGIFGDLARVERSPRGEYELTSAVEGLLARGGRIAVHPVGAWRDVGRPEDLEVAEGILKAGS